jgi:hypothetical protein
MVCCQYDKKNYTRVLSDIIKSEYESSRNLFCSLSDKQNEMAQQPIQYALRNIFGERIISRLCGLPDYLI